MALRDPIAGANGASDATTRAIRFFTLHREMNRLFDEVLRGFDTRPFASARFLDQAARWPNIEISETDEE